MEGVLARAGGVTLVSEGLYGSFTIIKKYMNRFFLYYLVIVISISSFKRGEKSTRCEITDIESLIKCKSEFGIERIRKMETPLNRLFFYANEGKCGFEYNQDSILVVRSYVIDFVNGSNTQVDVIKFRTKKYANQVATKLDPLVKAVRSIKTNEENRDFCLNYYLSRIYNYKLSNDIVYLFGYDARNVTSETISSENLKFLDRVRDSLK